MQSTRRTPKGDWSSTSSLRPLAGAALVMALLASALACGGPQRPPPPPPPKAPEAPPPPPPPPPEEPDPPNAKCETREKALADAYAPYLDAFVNTGVELSPDGKTLLFLSDRGNGTSQLYVASVDNPAAEPQVVAPATDRVADARFSPDGLALLFLRDQGRDENTQIYRVGVDGKELTPLTNAPQRFHDLPKVGPDWKTMVYLRGLHQSGGVVLVTQPLEGGEAKPVMKAKGFHALTDLSPDGTRALLSVQLSLSQSQVLLVELATGQKTFLAPSTGTRAQAHSGRFSADGKSVYLITDEGTERAALRKIDAASGKVLATFQDKAGEVSQVEVSPKGTPVAVVLDSGDHHTLKLLDGGTLKERGRVTTPLGSATLGRFAADGSGVVVTLSTPSSPSDVFLLSTSGRLKPLRKDKRPTLRKLVPISASVVSIQSFDGLKVPANLYLPKRLPKGKKLPTVVSVHGGPAYASVISWNPYVAFMISQGFAVLEPNLRGSTGFGKAYEQADNGRKRMDAVKDLAAVNQWLRQQPWADPERLVVQGGSYGGYMTYMALGHQPTLWRAGVARVGLANLETFLKTTAGAIRMVLREEFGALPTDATFLREISPITVVGQMRAPLYVYQGQNDPRCPRAEQDQIVRELRHRRVPVEYMVAPDEGHSLSTRPNRISFVARSTRFLEQHLGLPGLPDGCAIASSDQDESK